MVDDNVTYNIVIGPTSSSDVNYDGLEIVDLLLTNSNDDYLSDGLNWSEATSSAEFSGRSGFSSLVYQNKMWVIGGANRNDVWNSHNGINWNLVTNEANFSGRQHHTSVVFQDK